MAFLCLKKRPHACRFWDVGNVMCPAFKRRETSGGNVCNVIYCLPFDIPRRERKRERETMMKSKT